MFKMRANKVFARVTFMACLYI